MNVDKNEYSELTKKKSPKTNNLRTFTGAFFIGGFICLIGEILQNLYIYTGLDKDTAAIVMLITLIGISALLTGLNIYDKIALFGGAGTLVPITGFANAVVSPALEFKTEGYVLGIGSKLFVIAGPVIVYGITASVIYGLIYYLL